MMISGIGGGMDLTAMKQMMQEKMQQKFASSDVDSSGGLSLEEFQNSSPKELSDIEAVFAEIDTDGSGELSQEELRAHAESRMSENSQSQASVNGIQGGPPPSLLEALMAADTDGNGEVSLSEFEDNAPDGAEKIQDLFSKIDTDGSGELSQEEILAHAEGQRMRPPPPPPNDDVSSILEDILSDSAESDEAVFNALDADQDGEISEEELQKGVEQIKVAMMDYFLSLQAEAA